jgi:hypothetical protein
MRTATLWIPIAISAAVLASSCSDSTGPDESPIGSVIVTGPQTRIAIGTNLQLQASLLNRSGVTMSGGQVTWSSSDNAVATVTPGGMVSGLAGGISTISAAAGGVTGSIEIRVLPATCSAASITGAINPGQTRSGTLGPMDCLYDGFMERSARGWRLELSAPTSLQFDLGAEFPAELIITEPSMQIVRWFGGAPAGTTLRTTLPAGTFFVWITTANEEFGSFQLSLSLGPPLCTAASAGTIAPGQTIAGTISATDCLFLGEAHAVGWRLDLESTTRIGLDLTSTEFAALVVITDDDLNPLAWAFPSTMEGTARLVRTLRAGSYFVWATAADYGVGAFELAVQIEEPYTCAIPPTPISVGETVTGNITAADCRMETGTFGDAYTISLTQTTALQIDMSSNQLDTVLLLTDEGGAWLGLDDDGGVGTNSRLIITLSPGSYTIWATTFYPGEVGAYQLSVTSRPIGGSLRSPRPDAVGMDLGRAGFFQSRDKRAADPRMLP